ncbi:amidase [Bacillus infantis]|uniref:amidase n=1 Tax=Bacillus infantis TaxID=324767 RepID=UPI003CEF59CE
MKRWDELSIIETAELYRKTDLSPAEVVQDIFKRVKEMNEELNIFISLTEESALAAALKAERAFKRKEKQHILAGIPFSVKDLFDTSGVRTTCGSRILNSHIPRKTAPLIRLLDQFGAVMTGKTNMLEFAYGAVHPDYGQTNNPWDSSKTAGGSSGGSAASVAAGLSLFSLGTDTGGSIRIPASYCGIAGLKPTYGLLPVEGVFPLSDSLDHAGPMAKSAEDLLVIMESLYPQVAEFSDDEEALTVGVLPPVFFNGMDEDVMAAYNNTLAEAEKAGWKIREIDIPLFEQTEHILMNVLLPEAALVHEQWTGRKEDYAQITFKQIQAGLRHNSLDYLKARQQMAELRQQVDEALNAADILLMPTVSYPAPEEDPALEMDDEMKFTGIFNVTGHPDVTIPAGLSKEGLLIGMQLAGQHKEDIRLLKRAVRLEKLLGFSKKGGCNV